MNTQNDKYKQLLTKLLNSIINDSRAEILNTIILCWDSLHGAVPSDTLEKFNKSFVRLGLSVLGSRTSKEKARVARANGRKNKSHAKKN